MNKLYELSIKFIPAIIITKITDTDDNKFLELAVTANADFIITGNTNDFTFATYNGIKIVRPEQYVSSYFK